MAAPARAAARPVPSLTPAATQRLWSQLVHRRHLQARADCQPVRAVFYTQSDWLRLATNLAANASPCAQYYISVPPLAADKTALRSDQAWRIRALGPGFHALAEIQYAGWSQWVAAGNGSWYDAGVEARRRMAAAGFDVNAGDSWALNELSSGVRRGDSGARQAAEDFLRGLYDGGGGGAPAVKGVVFAIGIDQANTNLATYKSAIVGWLLDSGFWQAMSSYVSDFAQEVYGDVRAEAVAGAPVDGRIQHLNAYLAHPLALATAGPGDAATARAFLQSAYLPLANAAWSWSSAYGYTSVSLAQMEDYVTVEAAALRTLGLGRLGFAWAPRNVSATDSGALLDRLAAAIHDSDQTPTAACGTAWCTAGLPGAAFTEAWSTFSSWPLQVAVQAPPQLAVGQPTGLTVALLTNGSAQPLASATQVTLSSSSAGAGFASSSAGPFAPTLMVTIPAGASSVQVFYSDPNAGTPTLTATAFGALPAGQVVTVAAAPAQPTLQVALAASAKIAPPVGGRLAFVATVTNPSATPVSTATLQLTLPAGFAVAATAGAACAGEAGSLSCALGTVAQGSPVQVTVSGTVGRPGEQDATASAGGASASLRLPAPAARALRAPRVAGRPVVGSTLRAVAARWSVPPTRVTYAWQVCTGSRCSSMRGATAPRLRLRPAFAHRRLRVLATARFGATKVSAPSATVLVR